MTGLWKIDEQASAMLMEQFYKNLMDGLPKDEALRLAKLSYLEKAEGRMLAPQYWAGLVVMGNTAPVALKPKRSFLTWLLAFDVLLLAGIIFFSRNSKKKFD